MKEKFLKEHITAQLQRISWLRVFYYFWRNHGNQINQQEHSNTRKLGVEIRLTNVENARDNNGGLKLESVWPLWLPLIERGALATRWLCEFLSFPLPSTSQKRKDDYRLEDLIRPDFSSETFSSLRIIKDGQDITNSLEKRRIIDKTFEDIKKFADKIIAHPTTCEQPKIPHDKLNLCAGILYYLAEKYIPWDASHPFEDNSLITLLKNNGCNLDEFILVEDEN